MSGNQYQNEQFRKAARAAGVKGKRWNGDTAIDDCSEAMHNRFMRVERSDMNFKELVDWAKDWWRDHRGSYS